MEEEREGGRVRERDITPRQLVFFVTRGACLAHPAPPDPPFSTRSSLLWLRPAPPGEAAGGLSGSQVLLPVFIGLVQQRGRAKPKRDLDLQLH